MRHVVRTAQALICAALAGAAASQAFADIDPERGSRLHQSCLGCHGTELYMPGRAKVRSLVSLRREVEKWNDRYNPKFSKRDVDDLVEYLNRDFYRFR